MDLLYLWELTLVLMQLVLVIMTLFPMKEMPLFRLTFRITSLRHRKEIG